MRVTTSLAMPIIQRLQSLLEYNINIMDERGIIVASSDPNRMYQHHEGAMQVIRRGNEIVIPLETSQQQPLQGTKPGVNLPLEFNGETVGVVGITGNPAEVYPIARITKMSVETLLEQLYLQQQSQYRRAAIQSWMQELIGAPNPDARALEVVAHSLRLNVDRVRIGIIIQPIKAPGGSEDGSDASDRTDATEKADKANAVDAVDATLRVTAAAAALPVTVDQSQVEDMEARYARLEKTALSLDKQTLYTEDEGRYLLAVPYAASLANSSRSAPASGPALPSPPLPSPSPRSSSRMYADIDPDGPPSVDNRLNETVLSGASCFIQKMVTQLRKTYPEDQFAIGVGEPHRHVKGYRHTFQQAQRTVNLQSRMGETKPYIRDWGIIRLLDAVPESALNDFAGPYLQVLRNLTSQELETLQTFFDADGNSKATAAALHIHRNTLTYRLQKVADTTGLNPQRFSDAQTLSMLLSAMRLLGGTGG